jgi:hypothetical protein
LSFSSARLDHGTGLSYAQIVNQLGSAAAVAR